MRYLNFVLHIRNVIDTFFFQYKLSGTFFIRSQLWWNWPICMQEIQNLQIVHVTRFWAGIPRFWSCGNQFWWIANNHGLGAWENSGQNGKRPLTKRRRKEEEGEIYLHILSPKSLKTREGIIFHFFLRKDVEKRRRGNPLSPADILYGQLLLKLWHAIFPLVWTPTNPTINWTGLVK